jgi:hypothetical protein
MWWHCSCTAAWLLWLFRSQLALLSLPKGLSGAAWPAALFSAVVWVDMRRIMSAPELLTGVVALSQSRSVAGHAGPPALPPRGHPFYAMYSCSTQALLPLPCLLCMHMRSVCRRDLCIVRTSSPHARTARHRRVWVKSLCHGPPALSRFFLAVFPLLNSSLACMRSSSHCAARVDALDPNLASVCTSLLFTC